MLDIPIRGERKWLLVWVIRFTSKRKSKLQEKGDGPFQVLKRINYNAYKIALPLDYGVSNTFNVTDLTRCDVDTFDINLRANSSQDGGYDRGLSKEEEFGLGGLNMDGSITRARSKRFQEELDERLNSLMEEREKEVKFIYFTQILE